MNVSVVKTDIAKSFLMQSYQMPRQNNSFPIFFTVWFSAGVPIKKVTKVLKLVEFLSLRIFHSKRYDKKAIKNVYSIFTPVMFITKLV